MEVDSGRNGTGHGQKRTTEEEIPAGGDAKRSREEGGRNTTTACQDYQSMDEDEDNDYYNDDSNFLDSYRTTWATNYGKNDGSSFEDESEFFFFIAHQSHLIILILRTRSPNNFFTGVRLKKKFIYSRKISMSTIWPPILLMCKLFFFPSFFGHTSKLNFIRH